MKEIRIGPGVQLAVLGILAAVLAAAFLGGLPEFRRYLNIRSM